MVMAVPRICELYFTGVIFGGGGGGGGLTLTCRLLARLFQLKSVIASCNAH